MDKKADQKKLINVQVEIISDGEPIEIGVYEIVRREDDDGNKKRESQSIETSTQSHVEYVRDSVLDSLKQAQKKLRVYSQFDSVRQQLDSVISSLEEG